MHWMAVACAAVALRRLRPLEIRVTRAAQAAELPACAPPAAG
jgi:hypothetical protein